MTVPSRYIRYILAALAFGVAALGYLLLPVGADVGVSAADDGAGQGMR